MRRWYPTLLMVIAVSLVWYKWDCLVFRLQSTPDLILAGIEQHGPHRIVVIFGNPCTACDSGLALEQIAREGLLVFFASDYSDHEVRNFMETFRVMGVPRKDDGTIEQFFRRMSRCQKQPSWRRNYTFTVDEAGEIGDLRAF